MLLVFSHYCLQCYTKCLLTMTKKYDHAFILNGFDNWKKAKERFECHQVSECHREALVTQAKKDQVENRNMLLKQLSSLKFLL